MAFNTSHSTRPEVFCKKMFLKISQSLQENICAIVSFLIKLQDSVPQLYWKRFWHRCFSKTFTNFLRMPFLYQFKFFKGCPPQISLGLFLNTLSYTCIQKSSLNKVISPLNFWYFLTLKFELFAYILLKLLSTTLFKNVLYYWYFSWIFSYF